MQSWGAAGKTHCRRFPGSLSALAQGKAKDEGAGDIAHAWGDGTSDWDSYSQDGLRFELLSSELNGAARGSG